MLRPGSGSISWLAALLGLATLLAMVGCARGPRVVEVSGQTMGTRYAISAVDHRHELDPALIAEAVEAVLAEVNAKMSNWSPDSEISRINAIQTTAPTPISEALAQVLEVAGEVHERSDGQFDVTLAPLIDLWGFGVADPARRVPDPAAIEQALSRVGQGRLLRVTAQPPTLTKVEPALSIQLAALAKGYGVDAIAEALIGLGWQDFLVEIGGDLRAEGRNARREPWRIGIERPDATARAVQEVMAVSGLAMATSGDYRNYFEEDGIRYSHVIDAQTGRPVTHGTVSVTVLAEDAMRADAWATALLALGVERGLVIANRWHLAAMFVSRDEGEDATRFLTTVSKRFAHLRGVHTH